LAESQLITPRPHPGAELRKGVGYRLGHAANDISPER
jgi:hypothetical protein